MDNTNSDYLIRDVTEIEICKLFNIIVDYISIDGRRRAVVLSTDNGNERLG